MSINKKNYLFIFPALLLIFFSLISCGSGSGSGSGSSSSQGPAPADTSNTGSVAILLTDSPTDDFSEINITVTKIELLSDESKVTVFSGIKEIDLLDLKNETALFSIENNVPAAWYNKIRLTVTNVELIDKDGQPVTKPVKLPGNGKIDLNPRAPFSVVPGEVLTIQLDLDAEKSLKLDENKNKYVFRPVVFIDIIGSVPPEKMIRVKGIVHDIDLVNNTFRLCPDKNDVDSYTGASSDDVNDSCCVTIYVSDETSFFSAFMHGNPVPFEDLTEGASATVIGFYRMDSSTYTDRFYRMGVDAAVVQIGYFTKLKGMILSEVDPVTKQFDFLIDPDQEVESADPIKVKLQTGTKIYAHNGDALEESAIIGNRRAEIDGKLLLDPNPAVLNASFVSIDMGSPLSDTQSGEIDNINYSFRTFDLLTASSHVCVEAAVDAQIFRITDNGTLVSHLITFSELDDGDLVDIYGSYNITSGCLIGDTIIAFDIN